MDAINSAGPVASTPPPPSVSDASLPLSLPFWIVNSPKTDAAMANLAHDCGLMPEAHDYAA